MIDADGFADAYRALPVEVQAEIHAVIERAAEGKPRKNARRPEPRSSESWATWLDAERRNEAARAESNRNRLRRNRR